MRCMARQLSWLVQPQLSERCSEEKETMIDKPMSDDGWAELSAHTITQDIDAIAFIASIHLRSW